jgi:hypothetical protein
VWLSDLNARSQKCQHRDLRLLNLLSTFDQRAAIMRSNATHVPSIYASKSVLAATTAKRGGLTPALTMFQEKINQGNSWATACHSINSPLKDIVLITKALAFTFSHALREMYLVVSARVLESSAPAQNFDANFLLHRACDP